MKKLGIVLLIAIVVLLGEMWWLNDYYENRPCTHKWERKLGQRVFGTCIEKGYDIYTCSECGETKKEEDSYFGLHQVDEYTVVKKATRKERGSKKGICSLCGQEVTTAIDRIGSGVWAPVVMTSSELYKSVQKSGAKQYVGDWIRVTGTIKSVKKYSDIVGYYLEGKTGQGVVCWTSPYYTDLSVGKTVTFTGKVEVDSGNDHIELTGCILE